MEILKEGDLTRLTPKITFECKRCGCIFKADKGEYISGRSFDQSYATCTCPTCKNPCIKIWK